MGRITNMNSNTELVTEILDDVLKWKALKTIVDFLRSKSVQRVRVEFGFVIARDLAGEKQGPDQILGLADLEQFVRDGIDQGTIEWNGSSDFRFCPVGLELEFLLCNDGDLHFVSTESSLRAAVGNALQESGIKIYDSGQLV
jgi:hypothetical protein